MVGLVVGAVVALGVAAAVVYNALVRDRNLVASAWADVDVQLKRRHDLVPLLVEAVKGYAGHERGVLTAVTELRAQALPLSRPGELARVEQGLERALTGLIALREAYPDLQGSEHFLRLQRDLVEVEDQLSYARRFYNGAVRQYNTRRETFPGALVAGPFAFRPAEFFDAGDTQTPQVGL
jgi:LemA protein